MAKHVPPKIKYATIRRHLDNGKLVAFAPAINAKGEPHVVMLDARLSPHQHAAIIRAMPEERARLALKAIRQVREHFGIDDPKGTK